MRTWPRRLFLGLTAAVCLLGGAAAPPGKGERPGFAHVGDLDAEVTALNVIDALEPTAAQVKAFRSAAGKTMQDPPPRKLVRASAEYVRALRGLRDALLSGDSEVIGKRQEALDELREKEDFEPEDLEITEEARRQAPRLLKLFSARQVARYVGSLDAVPDPVERLDAALDAAHGEDRKGWPALRDDVAYQVGWLVAGLDASGEEKVRERAAALLDRAARLKNRDYRRRRGEFQREARRLVGDLDPTDVLRHFMQRVLAETLSNHRLEAALTQWSEAHRGS